MKDTESSDQSEPCRDSHSTPPLHLFWYLIPIIGFFPALWTLYHQPIERGREGDGEMESPNPKSRQLPQRGDPPHGTGSKIQNSLSVSRLSVTLAGSWLLGYVLLGAGAEMWEFLTLRLLLLNGLLTSGYFLVSLWLIIRLWRRKYPRLPGFSRFAERVVGKHLS